MFENVVDILVQDHVGLAYWLMSYTSESNNRYNEESIDWLISIYIYIVVFLFDS